MVAVGAGDCAVEGVAVGRRGAVTPLLVLLVHLHVVLVGFEQFVRRLFSEVSRGAALVLRKTGLWIIKSKSYYGCESA